MEPLFPAAPPAETIRDEVQDQLAAMRARRKELIDAGDEEAVGGRGRRRTPRGKPNPHELWSDDEIRKQARLELQRQLQAKDPKLRRDAAKEILDEIKAVEGEEASEVFYIVGTAEDFDPAKIEELQRLADQQAERARERAAQAGR